MKTQRWLTIAALVLAGGLAGCGGSDEAAVEDTSQAEDATGRVPSSALSSVQAFFGFVAGQVPADRAEPLNLQGAKPPTSETAEPMEVG